MAQPHRAGHEFGSKAMRRRIERKQRQRERLILAGKKCVRKKRKPVKKGPQPSAAKPYPCGPKQMTLGEYFPSLTPEPRP